MKPKTCKAKTRYGRKCLANASIDGYCIWHFPSILKEGQDPLIRKNQKLIAHHKNRVRQLEEEIKEMQKK